MSVVKLGIMSSAHMHAMSYASCVKALPGADLAAIWDDDVTRGRKLARQLSTKFIADQRAFLAKDLDGVIVCSENVKHRAMVEAAAAAGKWILCEKPLATTIADAKAMIATCRKAGVGLGTAFPCRYVEPLKEVKRLIGAGDLGEVYAVACTNNGSYPGGWFADEALSGGGATMDHTVHVADVLRWLTGKEFTTVYCETGKQIHRHLSTDDMGVMHFEMEGGIKATHVASWNRCESFPTWGDVTLQFIAEKGVLDVDAFNQKLDVYSDAAGKGAYVPWGSDANAALIVDFAEAVRERRDPAVSGEDGLRALAVTIAAYQSAKTGRVARVK